MWIYFNKNGQILETLEHGNIPNVGTTNFEIFAYFEGVNIRTDYPGANLKLIRPDLNQSSHEILPMKPVKRIFTNGAGNVNNYFVNGATYEGFLFNFNDFEADDEVIKLLDTPGLWTAVITLLSSSHGSANVQGEATFNVGGGKVRLQDVYETNDTARINELMELLATKLNINSDFYLRVLDDVNGYVLENGIFNNGIFNLNDILFSKSDKDFYKITSLSPAAVEKIGLDVSFNLENGDAIGSVVNKLAGNIANGEYSIALGYRTQTHVDSVGQTVVGKYNDPFYNDALFVVGNGDESRYANAFAVFEDGHAEVSSMKDNPYSVVQKNYVDNEIGDVKHRIEVLHAGSDVKDVVGTYQELSNYNISSLTLNDIIKVLQDETKEDATTYYRWNGSSFIFIGSVGPYYTIEETNSKLSNTLSYSKEYTNKKIDEVEKEINDFLLDHEEETYNHFSSVTITEANGSLIESGQRASLKEIGAFSYVENQLFSPRASGTFSGVQITNNGDGTLTFNGTATGDNYLDIADSNHRIDFIQGNKYLLSGGTTNLRISAGASSITSEWSETTPIIFTANATATSFIRCNIVNGITYNNITINIQLINLTQMFGPGNEPTTIEQWNALGISIPNEYVAPRIVSVRPTILKSYGEYASVDLGTLQWGYNQADPGKERFFSAGLLNLINTKLSKNIMCSKYETVTSGELISHAKDKSISNISGYISIYDSSYTDLETFKQSIQGVILYYQPAIPTNAALLGTINITLPQQFISAGNARDKLKVVDKGNGLYDLVHVSNVDSVDLSTIAFAQDKWWYKYDVINAKATEPYLLPNIICNNFTPAVFNDVFGGTKENSIGISANGKHIYIYDTSLTSSPTGILYYEKAIPTETTIASNLTFDQISLLVEYGGLLYIDKPGCDVTMDYIVKRSKILNIGVERDESNPNKTITAFYTPVVVYNEDKSKKVKVGDYVGEDNFGIYTPNLEVDNIVTDGWKNVNVYTDFDMNGNKITGLPEPTEDTDAVNKLYVSKLEDKVFELETLLYGSVWEESTATYPLLNVGVINKSDTNYPIVSNQYGALKEIKAFSYVENQLVQNGNFEDSSGWYGTGSTTLVVADNIATLTKPNSGLFGITTTMTIYQNHKYLLKIKAKSSKAFTFRIYTDNLGSFNYTLVGTKQLGGFVFTASNTRSSLIFVFENANLVENDVVELSDFNIIDLTLMGLDNITTIAEWEALGIEIPSEYVAPHIISARPTTLKSYSEYASVDLGTLTIFVTNANNGIFGTNSLKNLMVLPANNNVVANVKCNKYATTTAGNIYNSAYNEVIAVENSGALYFKSSAFVGKTASEVKALLSGVILKYKPANPTDAELLGTINLTLPTQFISARNSKDIVKVVAKANGLYDLVHVSNVDSVDMGTSIWTKTGYGWYTYKQDLGIKPTANKTTVGNILCSKYISGSSDAVQKTANDMIIGIDNAGYILFRDTSTSEMTQEEVRTFLSGTIFQYEKTIPTETVIASDLTFEQVSFLLQRGGSISLSGGPNDTILSVIEYKANV